MMNSCIWSWASKPAGDCTAVQVNTAPMKPQQCLHASLLPTCGCMHYSMLPAVTSSTLSGTKAAERQRTSVGAIIVVPLVVGAGVGHQSVGLSAGSHRAHIALSWGIVPARIQQLFGNLTPEKSRMLSIALMTSTINCFTDMSQERKHGASCSKLWELFRAGEHVALVIFHFWFETFSHVRAHEARVAKC